jgi:two-component system nitrate/nitrite response regulator NarL
VLAVGKRSSAVALAIEAGITVGILEDHRVTREAVIEFLERDGFRIVCASDNPRRFLVEMRVATPAAAILDLTIQVPDTRMAGDGLQVLHELRIIAPNVRPVVFSASMDPQIVERCYAEGACGYLFKSSTSCQEVAAALRRVVAGERIFPLQIRMPRQPEGPREPEPELLTRLTLREREILAYVAAGADNLKIAVLAQISERTVKAHVSNLYRKLEVENRTQLALRARELGVRAHQGV